jgi:hypothetical protein
MANVKFIYNCAFISAFETKLSADLTLTLLDIPRIPMWKTRNKTRFITPKKRLRLNKSSTIEMQKKLRIFHSLVWISLIEFLNHNIYTGYYLRDKLI